MEGRLDRNVEFVDTGQIFVFLMSCDQIPDVSGANSASLVNEGDINSTNGLGFLE